MNIFKGDDYVLKSIKANDMQVLKYSYSFILMVLLLFIINNIHSLYFY